MGVIIIEYITSKDASVKWGVSERRIQKLCEEGRIDGAIRFSKVWAIPKDAQKPSDARLRTNRKNDDSDHD